MTIGVPKEIKAQENRVAMLPHAAARLCSTGHRVVVQSGAGRGAGVDDSAYTEVGAAVAPGLAEVYAASDVVVKVKEPVEEELDLFCPGQTLFCYLHSETRPHLLDALLERRLTAIAYENVQLDDGRRPLLIPMSIIAGQQAVLQGMQFLYNHRGGIGLSLVRYPGIEPECIMILGAGYAGEQAARVAASLGADVIMIDIDEDRIRHLDAVLPRNVALMHGDAVNLRDLLGRVAMVIHATTIPADNETPLISRDMLACMRPGSIIVDVSANLNGAIETVDRYTTHTDPVYTVDGVVHYVVSNIPGTVARTSSAAIGTAVFPYLRQMADLGVVPALRASAPLCAGLTCIDGILTWHDAGRRLDRPWTPPADAVDSMATSS